MINSKYYRIPKKKEPLQENEIHLTSKQDPVNFLKYAIFLFEKRNLPYIKFKASGSAIAGLINIAEILKKVVPGVHQVNRIYTLKYEQDYEPKEKGLDQVTIVRNVPILEIGFYKELLELDMENLPGFQRALKPEIFERVQINFSNVIKKRNKETKQNNNSNNNNNFNNMHGNNQNNYNNNQSNSSYQVGFRGGMNNRGYNRGNRGGNVNGNGNRGGGRGLRGGFRGGNRGGNRGNRQNYDNYNYQNDHHIGYNNNVYSRGGGGSSVHSRPSTIRGFGRNDDRGVRMYQNNSNNNNNQD